MNDAAFKGMQIAQLKQTISQLFVAVYQPHDAVASISSLCMASVCVQPHVPGWNVVELLRTFAGQLPKTIGAFAMTSHSLDQLQRGVKNCFANLDTAKTRVLKSVHELPMGVKKLPLSGKTVPLEQTYNDVKKSNAVIAFSADW